MYKKSALLILILALLSAGVYSYVRAQSGAFTRPRTFTIRGRVIDLTTGQGKTGVTITGTTVPSGVATDSDGKFSFGITSASGLPVPFTITHPTVSGAQGVYAANSNSSNFWEFDYLDQMAGLRCRSERAFCSLTQVWRDKGSSSRYDFVVEPSISCTSATSTMQTIPLVAPDRTLLTITMSSEPGVATDGSRVIVSAAGSDQKLWVNSSTSLSGNAWSGWVLIGSGGVGNVASPAARALAKSKYAVFWTEGGTKFALLRDASRSRSGIVNLSSPLLYPSGTDLTTIIGDTTPRNTITFKTVRYRFQKSSDGKIQFQASCT